MKFARYLFLGCGLFVGCVHRTHDNAISQLPERLPPVFIFDGVTPEYVWQNFDSLHPWHAGNSFPKNFEDAGLQEPVALVGGNVFLDGGSQFYIFKGSNNKYLFLCTNVEGTQLYIFAYSSSSHSLAAVPPGSDCDKFLSDAIRKAVAKLDAKDSSNIASTNKPNQALLPTTTSVTDPAAQAPRQP